MTPVTLLKYDLDHEYLTKLAETLREGSQAYNDPRMGEVQIPFWTMARFSNDTYVNKVMGDFGVQGRPRFYYLKANTVIPEHVDFNTTCSLNFILNDDEPAPVTIEGVDYLYTQCLLNTTVMHGVKNGNKERLLFKISLFETPYETLATQLPYRLDVQN
jgi:hypothetical protein